MKSRVIDLGAMYTLWLREVKRYVRAKSRIVGTLGLPFFFLVIMGTGLSPMLRFPGVGVDYIDYMAPGIVGMVLIFTSVISGVSIIWDRQFGFLKEILVAPVSRTSIVLGKTLGGSTVAVCQGLLMLGVSIIVGFNVPSLHGLIFSLAFMLLISVAFVSLGIAFASRMEDPHGFQLIVNFVIMPLFFLSGALFPIDNLPRWLRMLALIDPLTYGVDGLRYSLIGVSAFHPVADLFILVGFCIVMIIFGAYLFRKS